MNKKYIALLFSLMAASAPYATLAKNKKTRKKISKKDNQKKWIIGGVVVLGSVAALGFCGWYLKKKKQGSDSGKLSLNAVSSDNDTDQNIKNVIHNSTNANKQHEKKIEPKKKREQGIDSGTDHHSDEEKNEVYITPNNTNKPPHPSVPPPN